MAEPALQQDSSDNEGQGVKIQSSNDNAGGGGGRQIDVQQGQSTDAGELQEGQSITLNLGGETEASNDNANTPEEKPGEEKPGEEKPGEEKPGEEKPGEEKPGEEKPGEEKPGEEQPDYNKKLEPWDKDQQTSEMPKAQKGIVDNKGGTGKQSKEDYTPPQVAPSEQAGAGAKIDENKQLTDKEREKRSSQEEPPKDKKIDHSSFGNKLNPFWRRNKRKIDKEDKKLDKVTKTLRGIEKKKKPIEWDLKYHKGELAVAEIRLLVLAILFFIGLIIALISWGYLSQIASWSWKLIQRIFKKILKIKKEIKKTKAKLKPIKKEMKKPLKDKKKIHKKITKLYNKTNYGGKDTKEKRELLAKNRK